MKKLLFALLPILPVPAVAQAPKEYGFWKAADLQAYAAKLGPRATNAQKLATENLANPQGLTAVMVHREGDGEAEYHESFADWIVIEKGEGSIVLGGTMKDAKTTGQGEMRGPSIEGGKPMQVAPGDIINVPAKLAHQVMVPKGGQITYFCLKVPAK